MLPFGSTPSSVACALVAAPCSRPRSAPCAAFPQRNCRHRRLVACPAALPSSDDGRTALPFPELLPYLLGTFSTVEEVAAFMDPAMVQVRMCLIK